MNIKTLLAISLLTFLQLFNINLAEARLSIEVDKARYSSMIKAEYASIILSLHGAIVSPKTLHSFAGIESLYGLNTKNRYTRAAKVMQIVPSTRKYILRKYKWIASQPESSLKEYVLAGAYLDYMRLYYSKYGVESTTPNLYLGYLLGPWYGVKTIRNANKKHPRHMSVLVGKDSYRNNRKLLNRSSRSLLKLVTKKLAKF